MSSSILEVLKVLKQLEHSSIALVYMVQGQIMVQGEIVLAICAQA